MDRSRKVLSAAPSPSLAFGFRTMSEAAQPPGDRRRRASPKLKRAARPPKRRSRAGEAPGAASHDPSAPKPRVLVLGYGPAGVQQIDPDQLLRAGVLPTDVPITWIHVQGLGDRELLGAIANLVGMHPLALEDVLHAGQRPKLEDYDDDLFMVLRTPGDDGLQLTNQVSIHAGPRSVVSFEEKVTPLFDPVFERVQRGIGRMRKDGTDYLCYALLDAAIDSFFPVVEAAGDRLDALEAETTMEPHANTLGKVYELKRDISILRRVITPHRDVANRLARGESEIVADASRVFFRDCYDHAVRVLDQLDQLREVATGLMELHVSLVGNRMNEVMRVLTVIATIFIPLTFVVGLYGMNFDTDASPFSMPELHWRYGYPAVLVVMGAIGGGMYMWFRRQGWLGGSSRRGP